MYEHVITHVTFTLFIMTAAGQDSCHTVHSVSDRTLVGHAYKTTSGKCLITCIIACDNDPNCYSLSYKFPMKTCELSSQTSRSHPNSFLLTPDSVYLDHPKRPGGSCVGDLPCRNKGKCENTPQAPGYMCVCRQHYVGEKCEVCSSPSLGMQDGRIQDSKITASSAGMWVDLKIFRAHGARLHHASSWVCALLDSAPWLKIQLPLPIKLVTRIATQGHPTHKWWTTSYTLSISLDGVWWRDYEQDGLTEVFLGNVNSNGVVWHDFSPPFKSQFIKILPLTKAGRTALRVEVYGCDAME